MQKEPSQNNGNKVLVIGAGLGGIRTALDLAEAGRDVVLIDKALSIGGLMTQLDRTFPTNNCDLCDVSPHLSESGRNLFVELMPMTQVTGFEGTVGRFQVSLTTAPRYIDLEKCTACGECYKKFPDCVRFSPGLDPRAPTCMRYPQATPYAYSIDMARCKDIPGLVASCPADAILPNDAAKTEQLEVGAVVLAVGAEVFDPSHVDNFGKAYLPNVLTSLEYERILSASGPTLGELVRPSDKRRPEKIAWIQCIGSRGLQQGFNSYCSSACCMYALKEAIVTKERFQDTIETTIFNMDMRTFGKDYELYKQRATDVFGVKLVRCRPHSLVTEEGTDNIKIVYSPYDGGENQTEVFDMVVLTTGFEIPQETVALANMLGIELNQHQFARTTTFDPVAASKPGIFVCGLFQGPKDIPETMVQASAAALSASRALGTRAAVAEHEDDFPPEKDVSGEPLRTGVFICDCGLNIGGVIDVEALVDFASGLPDVVASENIGHGCSRASIQHLESAVRKYNLNRVVIGACSPRTHETKFQDALRRAGLNKYLLEFANIRDQDTWVHADRPGKAAEKARELIRMAVASVALTHPLQDQFLSMNKSAMVVGGGVTGMTAALCMADAGHKVFLVERNPELGGVAKKIHRTLEGDDVKAFIKDLTERTTAHENIQVLTNAFIVDHTGMPGMFKTGLQLGPGMFYRQITHGVTILATGALPNRPDAYLLDRHPAVMTQLELDERIEDQPADVKAYENVVMIQCVGSRCPENPNCSRVCCQAAIKNALRIREVNPDARIFVLYRDMRTYGFQEDYYRQARDAGVIFVNYKTEDPPVVTASGDQVDVEFLDPILGRRLLVTADCLGLSTGFVADEESTEDLARIFHLQRTADNFLLEDHVKLRPVDLPIPGFYVAGTAHAPKNISESIAQAQAAAGRAQTLLARDTINLGAAVAKVDETKCAACLICVRACPFSIPFINADGVSEIDPAKCHGCGTCAAECPAKAIQLMQYEDDQILAKLLGLLERVN